MWNLPAPGAPAPRRTVYRSLRTPPSPPRHAPERSRTPRPVQLIPQEDAKAGGIARSVPTYGPGPCDGCPHTGICEERGDATAFKVREVLGEPLHCQKRDGNLVACRAEHFPELEEEAPSQQEGAAPDEAPLLELAHVVPDGLAGDVELPGDAPLPHPVGARAPPFEGRPTAL